MCNSIIFTVVKTTVRLGLAQATETTIMEIVRNMRILVKGKGDAYGDKEKNYLAG